MSLSGPLHSLVLAGLMMASAGLPGFTSQKEHSPQVHLAAITEIAASHGGHFVVNADINGVLVKALVDTGATAVALSYEDAMKAGVKPSTLKFDVPVSTANGQAMAARIKLRHVMIDNVKVRDVDGMVLKKGAMRGTLLGMSFLGRLRSFSVENGKLVLKN